MVDEHRRVVPARPTCERRELLFARTLLPLPRSVSHGTETALKLQALRQRRRGKVTPHACPLRPSLCYSKRQGIVAVCVEMFPV